MQIPQNVIDMLSAKGKGYVEAAMKIAHGQKLVEEGTIEIAALDGKKLAEGKNVNAGGIDVLAVVRDLAKPKVASDTDALAPKSRINKRQTLLNKTMRRPAATPANDAMFGKQAPRCKMVLEAIQKDPWMNTTRITKEVLGNHATSAEVCAMLEKAGMIKLVDKANNPAHTGAIFHRAFEYWEADPEARIDVVNMHVARMTVRNPATLYPAIEAAIKSAKGWASKHMLKASTGLSDEPLNRVLKAMVKKGLIKAVWKKHNPAHKHPKNFERLALYWEMVGGA